MSGMITQLNNAGDLFIAIAVPMLIQSSVLAALVLFGEMKLRRHLCAATRYWILMLVFVQLMLVPGFLSVPRTGGWSGISNAQANSSSPSSLPETGHPYTYAAGTHQSVRFNNLSWEAQSLEARSESATTKNNSSHPEFASLSWQGGVFLLWGLTVLGLSVLALRRLHHEQRILHQSQPGSRMMNDLFEYASEQVGMNRPVKLRVSDQVTSPQVMGMLEPVVVVPQNLGPALGSRPLRASLIHSLAFIKQGYGLFNGMQTVIHILYFFHPLVWVVRWAAQRTAAEAVKEWVLRNGAAAATGQHERMLAEVHQFTHPAPTWSRFWNSIYRPSSALPA